MKLSKNLEATLNASLQEIRKPQKPRRHDIGTVALIAVTLGMLAGISWAFANATDTRPAFATKECFDAQAKFITGPIPKSGMDLEEKRLHQQMLAQCK